jgi:sterol desaturase/sphingolipid hydroxylase (fatty acid hydroxylase superfamily)
MKSLGYTPLIVIGVFILLFAVEKFFPLRESKAGLIARLIINGSISAVAFLVAATVVRPSALLTLDWASARPFGLINLVPLSGWAQFIVGFLLLDLSFYYWHIANQCNTLFHHSNLRLPIRLERWLNRFLVTPRMHGIHHSQVRPETNSNYGVVFSWWDKLHRTLGLNIPQSKIEIGIAGYSLPEDNRLWHAFTLPFRRQRDYWRKPDGTTAERDAADLGERHTRLVE